MEKIYKLMLLLVFPIWLFGCKNNPPQIKENIKEEQKEEIKEEKDPDLRFTLYPTDNMWTFIELDTSNGRMWQVQYSVEGNEYRFDVPLNLTVLTDEAVMGRFELYKTQNMYNFVLLDRINGNTWQVQWSTEPENRGIVPILNADISGMNKCIVYE